MNYIHLEIAGLSIRLSSPFSAMEMGISSHLASFIALPGNGAWDAVIHWQEGVPRLTGEKQLYDEGPCWRLYRAHGSHPYRALIYYPERDGIPGTQALLEANASWDDLIVTESRPAPEWWSLLNLGIGELLVRIRLIFLEGLVFHACGIRDHGKGVLFVGHSGAGKSTQAALWQTIPGVIVLSDERMAVRINQAGATCYGTPWGGSLEIVSNHNAPLAAITILEQAEESSMDLLPPERAFAMLLARSFAPYWEPGLMTRALETLEKLLNRIPIFRLRCRSAGDAVTLVRSVL